MAGQILVVALICANSIQASDCTRDNALDVITAPAHSLQECMIQGPTMAAYAGHEGTSKDTYIKTRCEPRR